MADYKSSYTGQEIDAGIAKANTALQEHQDISGKVDKVQGKQLSTNDFTNEEKAKLDNIDMSTKQDTLVSGTNIKTINNQSILGSGNLEIGGGSGTSDYDQLSNRPSINNNTLTGDKTSSQLGLQDTLVSGENIKTINNTSILGSGNIDIEGGSGTDSWNAVAKALLITILRNGVYSSDQSTNISALQQALAGGSGDGYVISAILQNVSIDNDDIIVQPNSSYTAHLTADSGYTLDTVTVTMGGLDITSTAYSNGTISIATVTANVVIMATATQEQPSGGFDYDPTKWVMGKKPDPITGEIVDTANAAYYSEQIPCENGSKISAKGSGAAGLYFYGYKEDGTYISGGAESMFINRGNNYEDEMTIGLTEVAKVYMAVLQNSQVNNITNVEVE